MSMIATIIKRVQSGDDKGTHTSRTIGQSGDLSAGFDNHHQQGCFTEHGANCFCLHLDSNEASRLEEERDLINELQPACNDERNR